MDRCEHGMHTDLSCGDCIIEENEELIEERAALRMRILDLEYQLDWAGENLANAQSLMKDIIEGVVKRNPVARDNVGDQSARAIRLADQIVDSSEGHWDGTPDKALVAGYRALRAEMKRKG